MTNISKQLSNPFSTGGGGGHFEAHVQASFVALMLTGGFAPCLPCWPISKIKLQAKHVGYDTDDLIVFAEQPSSDQKRKIFGNIKHSISITEKDKVFGEVIQAAWNDFNNAALFTKQNDVIALITGPLSATDINDVRWLLEQARHLENAEEFIRKVVLANFSSQSKHWVDPTGKPERDLAEHYRQKADQVENAGYQRFAVTLRNLSESYDHDADRVVADHNGPETDNT